MPGSPAPEPYDVRLSPRANAEWLALKAAAENAEGGVDGHTTHATIYRYLVRLIERLRADPFHPSFRLKHDLAGIFRDKFGRMRIFWAASSERRRVVVLLFGYRKEGDRKDAYEVPRRVLRSPELAPSFEWVGARNPHRPRS
ncbi:MAG: hypothetical protein AABZ30_12735 [Myxococcota bacterium]